ncbi:MAG: hypothetical protein ACLFM8_00315 [Halobacteriales archaeon]
MSKRLAIVGLVGMAVFLLATLALLAMGEMVFAGTTLILFSFSLYLRESNK